MPPIFTKNRKNIKSLTGFIKKTTKAHKQVMGEGRHPVTGLTVDELGTPSILPCHFDKSFDLWLKRLDVWGTPKFWYIDPYTRRKTSITRAKFLDAMQSVPLKQATGDLKFREMHVHSLEISRIFKGVNGKERVEKFIIDIDLIKELRLSFWQRVLTALGL